MKSGMQKPIKQLRLSLVDGVSAARKVGSTPAVSCILGVLWTCVYISLHIFRLTCYYFHLGVCLPGLRRSVGAEALTARTAKIMTRRRRWYVRAEGRETMRWSRPVVID